MEEVEGTQLTVNPTFNETDLKEDGHINKIITNYQFIATAVHLVNHYFASVPSRNR